MRSFEDSLRWLALELIDFCFIHDIDSFSRGDQQPASADIMQKVAAIEAVCREHDVPLPAAAMQFVVAHPAIPSFIAGTRTVDQLEKTPAWFGHPISPAFWQNLKARKLLREDAPVPA